MKVKWSNVAVAALIVLGIWLWKRAPGPPGMPMFYGPLGNAFTLAFWAILFMTILGIVRLLARKK